MLAAIPLDSPGARIIADTMESGGTIKRAHANCIAWLRIRYKAGEKDVPDWRLSATYSCYLRMNPTITVVEKRAQGSFDPNSPWCKACLGWVTQLLIRTE